MFSYSWCRRNRIKIYTVQLNKVIESFRIVVEVNEVELITPKIYELKNRRQKKYIYETVNELRYVFYTKQTSNT